MEKLAIQGGPKAVNNAFRRYNPIGEEECTAVQEVMKTGVLSKYIAVWDSDFFGGEKVKEFEDQIQQYFKIKHAVVVNSCTSGLIAAVGALGIEPGDEVIVSPWTMSGTATAILVWNAIPVFADISEDTFTIDPASIEKNITSRTKAIIAVDIYGQSADMDSILEIADRHDLKVISDCAQAPSARYKNKFAGTLADIGVYSLNYHKHIHTGEGGFIVTNNDSLAERLQLIRNHAEAVVENKGVTNLSNMIGFNFRMGEIEAAIGIQQLKKLGPITDRITEIGEKLNKGLKELKGLRIPYVQEECTHVYYAYPIVLDIGTLGIKRDQIHQALAAEGVPIGQGYVNVHQLPLYQHKIAYGSNGFPWNAEFCSSNTSYEKGICPVAEKYHEEQVISIPTCMYNWSDDDVDLIVKAFHKVWLHLDEL
jgi:perosamine synthetase